MTLLRRQFPGDDSRGRPFVIGSGSMEEAHKAEEYVQAVHVDEDACWYVSVIAKSFLEEIRIDCRESRISGLEVLMYNSGKKSEFNETEISEAFNDLDDLLAEAGVERVKINNEMVACTFMPTCMTFFTGTHNYGRWPKQA